MPSPGRARSHGQPESTLLPAPATGWAEDRGITRTKIKHENDNESVCWRHVGLQLDDAQFVRHCGFCMLSLMSTDQTKGFTSEAYLYIRDHGNNPGLDRNHVRNLKYAVKRDNFRHFYTCVTFYAWFNCTSLKPGHSRPTPWNLL